jgi:hypothetical protein
MAMSRSTPEPVRPDLGGYLRELTARLVAILDDRLVGAWVVGSSALGDFDARRSDVDVQAVCSTRPARAELEELTRLLSHEALPCPVRGLEFVLYARADLADPSGPAFVLNLNTGAGMRHHVGLDPGAEPRFWFTLDVAIAREHAHRLAGAPPAEVLPAVAAGSHRGCATRRRRVVQRRRRRRGDPRAQPRVGVGGRRPLAVERRCRDVGGGAA